MNEKERINMIKETIRHTFPVVVNKYKPIGEAIMAGEYDGDIPLEISENYDKPIHKHEKNIVQIELIRAKPRRRSFSIDVLRQARKGDFYEL